MKILFRNIKTKEELLTRVSDYTKEGTPVISTGNQYWKITPLLSKTQTETQTQKVIIEYTNRTSSIGSVTRYI